MRTYTRKINRHVNYVTAAGKLKPATITALGAGQLVDLRIGRAGGTHLGVAKQTADNQTNVWRNTDAFQNV